MYITSTIKSDEFYKNILHQIVTRNHSHFTKQCTLFTLDRLHLILLSQLHFKITKDFANIEALQNLTISILNNISIDKATMFYEVPVERANNYIDNKVVYFELNENVSPRNMAHMTSYQIL